jgi:preprotein translocase subunit SecE
MGVVRKSIGFFGEVRSEVDKCTLPDKDELVSSTIVVLVVSALLSIFIGLVDRGLTVVVAMIFG